MKIKQIITGLMAGFILITQAGCLALGVAAAVGAGAGYAYHSKGDLEVTSTKSLDEVFAAVEEICTEMNFTGMESEKKDDFFAQVKAKSHHGPVTFKIESEALGKTAVSIRVGSFGDPSYSEIIYAKLKTKI